MKCLRSLWELQQISFQALSESVEETPNRPVLEVSMPGFPPFVEDGGNQAVGTRSDIRGSDDQVASSSLAFR